MIRLMLDTDKPLGLTVTTGMLATYADLADAPLVAHLSRTHGHVVWIERGLGDPLGLATILDVEGGAVRPAQAPVWYDRRHAQGAKSLTVYCNRSTLAEVDTEMGPRNFYRWVARLDGISAVPGFTPGKSPAAVQIMGAAALGFHADASLVFQDAWQPTPRAHLSPDDSAAINTAEAHIQAALAALAGVQ